MNKKILAILLTSIISANISNVAANGDAAASASTLSSIAKYGAYIDSVNTVSRIFKYGAHTVIALGSGFALFKCAQDIKKYIDGEDSYLGKIIYVSQDLATTAKTGFDAIKADPKKHVQGIVILGGGALVILVTLGVAVHINKKGAAPVVLNQSDWKKALQLIKDGAKMVSQGGVKIIRNAATAAQCTTQEQRTSCTSLFTFIA